MRQKLNRRQQLWNTPNCHILSHLILNRVSGLFSLKRIVSTDAGAGCLTLLSCHNELIRREHVLQTSILKEAGQIQKLGRGINICKECYNIESIYTIDGPRILYQFS